MDNEKYVRFIKGLSKLKNDKVKIVLAIGMVVLYMGIYMLCLEVINYINHEIMKNLVTCIFNVLFIVLIVKSFVKLCIMFASPVGFKDMQSDLRIINIKSISIIKNKTFIL